MEMIYRLETFPKAQEYSTKVEMAESSGLKYLHPANVTEMFKIIKAAQPIRSLYGKDFPEAMKKIKILYTPARGESKGFSISIHPFSTLLDIKVGIFEYIKNHHEEFGLSEAAEEASPIFQSVLYSKAEIRTGEITATLENKLFSALDYFFTKLGTKSEIFLPNPLIYIKQESESSRKKKSQFITEEGERQVLGIEFRSRVTYETAILEEVAEETTPIFFLFLFRDLYESVDKPVSEADWNGLLYPFFPYLTQQQITLDAKNKKGLSFQTEIFRQSNLFTAKLDTLLGSGIPLRELTLAGIRFLQFSWPQKQESPEGLEALFYDAQVSKYRPYMRLLPSSGSPISKLHMVNEKPDIPDARTLLQWSREKSPTPGRDYAFAKILIKEQVGQNFPLYMTLRLFDDTTHTADMILIPPKNVRKLNPISDLEEIETFLQEGLSDTPYLKQPCNLYNSTFIYGIKLEKIDQVYTKRILLNKIKLFSTFFQVIAPLPGENPIIMLRYKKVDNFASQDRILSFIEQYATRLQLFSEQDEKDIAIQQKRSSVIDKVMEEFQIDEDEATKRVSQWWKRTEMTISSPESKDYIMTYNPGIDIAIFGSHPFYTFHLYRIDSLSSLRRIITLLSLLFSADEKDLFIPKSNLEVLEAAETGLGNLQKEEEEKEEEEEEEEEETDKVTVGAKGAKPSYLDDLLFLEEDLGDEDSLEDAPAPESVPSIKEQVAKDSVAPKEELEAVKLVAPKMGVAAPARNLNEESVIEETEGDLFLKKLKEADSRLFDYTKTHPSLKKYVSQCAANVTRQPAVMTKKEYQNMRELYKDEETRGLVEFVEYPLEKEAEKDKKKKKEDKEEAIPVGRFREKFYFLEYGSNPKNFNWYVCSKYFCTRDNIVLISQEFESPGKFRRPVVNSSGVERALNSKPAKMCPFCGGREISNRRKPAANETVLVRTTAPKSSEIHQYIGFLKATHHPDGFYLPCCFLTPKTILRKDVQFEKPRLMGLPVTAKKEEEGLEEYELDDDDDGSELSESDFPETEDIEYSIEEYADIYILQMARASQRQEYIVGAEKLPLEVSKRKKVTKEGQLLKQKFKITPQVGLLPIALDKYFAQHPQNFVKTKVPQKVKPASAGFLRIAVENRLRFKPNSFVSAIAPFYGKNTAKEFLDEVMKVMTPNIFLQTNYGNLVHEFYKLNLPTPDDEVLKKWISDEGLMVDLNDANHEAVVRLYISYNSFIAKLKDESFIKEYRHFAALCAEPNLLRGKKTRGLTFIILDLVIDEITKEEKVEVRCPTYGFNAAIHSDNDFAFIMRHYTGIWEPIFYVDNRPGKEPYYDIFTREKERLGVWPYPVKDRVEEFIGQCRSRTDGRLSYASASISPLLLPSISQVMNLFFGSKEIVPYGMVRDSYNHLAAVLCDISKLYHKRQFIHIPAVDDGYIKQSWRKVCLDWDDIRTSELATVEVAIDFYTKYLVTPLQARSDFTPTKIFDLEGKGGQFQLGAMELVNGCIFPVSNPSNMADVKNLENHIPEGTDAIYIDTEKGNDTNDGSEESPIQTLGAAVQYARRFVSVLEIVYVTKYDIITIQYSKTKPENLVWNRNKQIVYDRGGSEETVPSIIYTTQKDLNEIYEHLRIRFANWIATLPNARDLRKKIQAIVDDDDTPLYMKRKKLDQILNRQPMSWMLGDADYEIPKEQALRRIDCSVQEKGKCETSGRCKWNDSANKCLLHVPATTSLGFQDVQVPRLMYVKLIEEILRYAEKRNQLFEKQVSYMIDLDNPIRRGNEYIVPEKSAAWYELMRFEWAQKADEKAIYLEEKSAKGDGEAYGVIGPEYSLPESVKTFLDVADEKVAVLRRKASTLQSILGLTSITADDILPPLTPSSQKLTAQQIGMLVRQIRMVVVQLDIRREPFELIVKKPYGTSSTTRVFFLLIEDDDVSVIVRDPIALSMPILSDMPTSILEKIKIADVIGAPVQGSIKEALLKRKQTKV
jgi:hypothetical protein